MKLIQPDFQIIEQEQGIEGIYKAIEYPGRVCYGSTDKITEGSAEKFVHDILEKSNHGAPMEHGAVYLDIPEDIDDFESYCEFYTNNEYSKIEIVHAVTYGDLMIHACISTNYRVLFENGRLDDLKYICEPTEYHHRRVTVKFTCDIGISREFNRHRKDSINEESTRYCNYSKDKYGNEIGIIVNNNKFGDRLLPLYADECRDFKSYCTQIMNDWDFSDIDYWMFANKAAEFSYVGLTQKCGWKPQDARNILPLDTKSILVHSAFIEDWEHFFSLRAIGTTGAPHPQAKELAEPLMKEFVKRGYIKDEKE